MPIALSFLVVKVRRASEEKRGPVWKEATCVTRGVTPCEKMGRYASLKRNDQRSAIGVEHTPARCALLVGLLYKTDLPAHIQTALGVEPSPGEIASDTRLDDIMKPPRRCHSEWRCQLVMTAPFGMVEGGANKTRRHQPYFVAQNNDVVWLHFRYQTMLGVS